MMKNKGRLAQTLVFFYAFILGSFGHPLLLETSYLLIHEGKDSLDRVEIGERRKKLTNPCKNSQNVI